MRAILLLSLLFSLAISAAAQQTFDKDIIKTSAGDLTITCVGHGTLMFEFKDLVIHIDPVSREADYATMPKADLILVTHEHGDHLDLKAIGQITTDNTVFIGTKICSDRGADCLIMKNGDTMKVKGIDIKAVPAYNIINKRNNGTPFHPKGSGNGYILTFGDKNIYIGGDTEINPEMKTLKNIDIAFLPMNLPYTMTPAMVAEAVKAFKPAIVYPYHFGRTNTQELVDLLKDEPYIEVRIRKF